MKSPNSSGIKDTTHGTTRIKTKQVKGVKESSAVRRGRARSLSPMVQQSSNKRQKKADKPDEHLSPSFHMTQTQNTEVVLPSFPQHSPTSKAGPLRGYLFFVSGIDREKINKTITRLGGEVLVDLKISSLEKNRG